MSGQKSEVNELDSESTADVDVDVHFAAASLVGHRPSVIVRPNVDAEGGGIEAERCHFLVEREDRAHRELVERGRQDWLQKVKMVVETEDYLGESQRDLEKQTQFL